MGIGDTQGEEAKTLVYCGYDRTWGGDHWLVDMKVGGTGAKMRMANGRTRVEEESTGEAVRGAPPGSKHGRYGHVG